MKGKRSAVTRTAAKKGSVSVKKVVGAAATRGRKRTSSAPSDEPPLKLPRAPSANTVLRQAIADVKSGGDRADGTPQKKRTFKVDTFLRCSASAQVYKDYSCMLNQTNIGANNNKFYVVQLVQDGKQYKLFTRWGRVGDPGQNKTDAFVDAEKAIKAFEKKFSDKTCNKWDNRHEFAPQNKKYTLLDMDEEDEEGEDTVDSGLLVVQSKVGTVPKSKLDERTQKLAKLIFSDDMFSQQMAEMHLDVKRMPLGKLSKSQIAKGLEAMLDIEDAIKNKKRADLKQLSSIFYTLIPHNFGRKVPPVIDDLAVVQQKKDMLITLADIELAQTLQKTKKAEALLENPLDAKIAALGCSVTLLKTTSTEYKWISAYATACPLSRKGKLIDVWQIDRNGEDLRFSANDAIDHRRLLWHGTSVAVVAAILNSGLRIMPHSGGRVGRGIYFASEHAKSSYYVGVHYGDFEGEKNVGFMFLVEVALGRTHNITQSSGTQTCAPKGFDSIVARGRTEPDEQSDMEIKLDGKKVIVPKGAPVEIAKYSDSHFGQSEYLVYRENQARLRYLLKFSFDH